jgi:hypothetical protein
MFAHPQNGYTRDGFRFFAEYDICQQGMALYIARREPRNLIETHQVAHLEWTTPDCGARYSPTLLCAPESMQCLFNALWERGFRPSSPLRPDAIVEAKDAHIEDLRTIIFSQLGVK